jgi:hypothetical protein
VSDKYSGAFKDFRNPAKFYVALGFTPIPVNRCTKSPRLSAGFLGEYLRRKPADAEIESWFGESDDNLGLGLIVPPGLLVIDIDGKDLWPLVSSKTPEMKAKETWVHETPRGFRIFLKLPEGYNAKAVKATFPGEHRGIELKPGGKCYVIAHAPESMGQALRKHWSQAAVASSGARDTRESAEAIP